MNDERDNSGLVAGIVALFVIVLIVGLGVGGVAMYRMASQQRQAAIALEAARAREQAAVERARIAQEQAEKLAAPDSQPVDRAPKIQNASPEKSGDTPAKRDESTQN